MPNTENTILENWPGPKTSEAPHGPVYHFAVKQSSVNLDFHIERFFRDVQTSFHYFSHFDTLQVLCQRYPIDAIVIGSQKDILRDIELAKNIKQHVFLSIIPVILYHPDPDDVTVIAGFESGAEEFIRGAWVDKLVQVRVRKIVERSRRDLSVNPSTRLPGPSLIEREIVKQIERGADFAVGYADLDNFKAYNDYYGYTYGDKVIRLTARVLKDVVFDYCPEGFLGHIAGDDFIFMVPSDILDPVCINIIKTFDLLIPFSYDTPERERGYIETNNRKGEFERFNLLTMSIAVLVNSNGKFEHIGEMSKMLADLKKATKAKQGSNYMVERRKKY